MSSDALKRQLEKTRFERALEVAESLAEHRALLTTVELARLNAICTGRKEDDIDKVWRTGTITLQLPSGRSETLSLIADPKAGTREKLHRATETAEAGSPVDAAVDIYVGLVLDHFFEDANRRTAVLAAHYFLQRYGVPLSALAIHEIGLGDLREPGQIEALRETVQQMAKFALKQRPPAK